MNKTTKNFRQLAVLPYFDKTGKNSVISLEKVHEEKALDQWAHLSFADPGLPLFFAARIQEFIRTVSKDMLKKGAPIPCMDTVDILCKLTGCYNKLLKLADKGNMESPEVRKEKLMRALAPVNKLFRPDNTGK